MVLVVSIWMLKDTKISLWRKIRVIFLLSLGLFVMGMAIARCILSIGASVQVALSSVWAQRAAVSLHIRTAQLYPPLILAPRSYPS
jgi:hypothetical protein